MVEYIVRTDKPIRLNEVLHLHGVHNFEVKRMDKHGDLIERSKVHEAITQAYCLEDVPSIIDQLVPTVLEAST